MEIMDKTLWVAHKLFDRGLVTGSTGNISFKDGDKIYISLSGSCFGLLDENSWAIINISGEIIKGKPSKEYPLHLNIYQANSEVNCVIHTHSFYGTLASCVKDLKVEELFSYTPYLKMQTGGKIGMVEYHKPGSNELFEAFNKQVSNDTAVYFLKNHGVITASEDPYKAFYLHEELIETCRLYTSIKKDLEYEQIAF